jgi:subtilisin family serine protease
MDSRLKLIINGDPEEVLMLLIRLKDPGVIVPHCKVVAQFGDIITTRVQRKYLLEIYNLPGVFSVKAPRLIPAPLHVESDVTKDAFNGNEKKSRNLQSVYSGKGIYFASVDWGFDFSHANLRKPDGATRFKCIWDQNGRYDGNRYGYGCFHFEDAINKALQTETPYHSLGYHPGRADALGSGMHGTHVVDIAAGRHEIGEGGVAPEATLIGVELGNNFVNGSDLALGDSVRLVEALDFISSQIKDAPCVINMSLGSHGDSHTGKSLVEIAFDNFLTHTAGVAIVQSVGNYYIANCHLQHTIKQNEVYNIELNVPGRNPSPDEVEIWYPGIDAFAVQLIAPDGEIAATAEPFTDIQISWKGKPVGYIFHRANEPNTGLNHIDVILDISVPHGKWIIQLTGTRVVDGALHAYCERNDASQPKFSTTQSSPLTTTGSICNNVNTITVGAYNHTDAVKPVVRFSSSGPTAFGQIKPDLLAPGYKISAARSAPLNASGAIDQLTVKSGSSMAAPHVSGAIACLFQKHLPERLSILKTKQLLFNALDHLPSWFSDADEKRSGKGYLNINKLLVKNSFMDTNVTRPVRKVFVTGSGSGDNSADADEQYNNEPELLIDANVLYNHFHPRYRSYIDPGSVSFCVVAGPRKKLNAPLQSGDVILFRSYLSGNTGNFVITDPSVVESPDLTDAVSNSKRNGQYLRVAAPKRRGNTRLYFRVADRNNVVPGNVVIVRKVDSDTPQPAGLSWEKPDLPSIDNPDPQTNDPDTDPATADITTEDIGPSFCTADGKKISLTQIQNAIADAAKTEHQWWLKGAAGHQIQEQTKEAIMRITWYWSNIPNAAAHEVPQTAWSAVFVCSCIRVAFATLNISPVPIHLSSAHFQYAKSAYNRRFHQPPQQGFYWAYDPLERPVQKGDIIVKERLQADHHYIGLTFGSLNSIDGASTHGDIVVEVTVNPAKAIVIGGNVRDSVNQNSYLLTAEGKIDTQQPGYGANRVFAVLSLEPPDACSLQSNVSAALPSTSGPGIATTASDLVKDLIQNGKLTVEIGAAILGGEKNQNKLTDMIFFHQHPERTVNGKQVPISANESGYRQLRQEWLEIRSKIILPIMKILTQ